MRARVAAVGVRRRVRFRAQAVQLVVDAETQLAHSDRTAATARPQPWHPRRASLPAAGHSPASPPLPAVCVFPPSHADLVRALPLSDPTDPRLADGPVQKKGQKMDLNTFLADESEPPSSPPARASHSAQTSVSWLTPSGFFFFSHRHGRVLGGRDGHAPDRACVDSSLYHGGGINALTAAVWTPPAASAAPSFGDDGALGGSHLSRGFGGGGRDGTPSLVTVTP